jgi:hypothetical protein
MSHAAAPGSPTARDAAPPPLGGRSRRQVATLAFAGVIFACLTASTFSGAAVDAPITAAPSGHAPRWSPAPRAEAAPASPAHNSPPNRSPPPPMDVAAAAAGGATSGAEGTAREFRFHVYDIPSMYIDGALKLLEERWPTSHCNRRTPKTNYTMLDWRHAHSLFTVDVFMAKYLRHHPQHTADPDLADVFVIPMMTHVYNCAGVMGYMNEILAWVTQRRERHYKQMDQHDHYIFWWRWGMHHGSVIKFWKRMAKYFSNANLISFDYLELQGRNEWQDFSLALRPNFLAAAHHVVVPYPDFSPPLLTPIPAARLHAPRPVLFFFAGTANIGGIRRHIKRACDAAPAADCLFRDFGASVVDSKRLGVPQDYPSAMQQATFCGHAAGDALSSRRPTSAVLAGCIPVLVCDLCLYAWENFIDYSKFAVFVSEDDVMAGRLFPILRNVSAARVAAMQRALREVRPAFVYNTRGPPAPGDALSMLVKQLEVRGSVYRQYRRWYRGNAHLSADRRDYPVEPRPVKKYFRNSTDRDPNNLRGRAQP